MHGFDAEALAPEGSIRPPALLVPLQQQGTGTPVIFCPSFRKTAMNYRDLAQALAPDMPVYSFVWPEPTSENPPANTVESITEEFLQDLKIQIPHGPYIIGGYCFGAVIALEMAKRLDASGEQVEFLVLIDPVRPSAATPWQQWKQRRISSFRFLRQRGIRFFLRSQYGKGLALLQYLRSNARERLEHQFYSAHHRAFYRYQVTPSLHRALLVFSHAEQKECETKRYMREDNRWKEILPHDREILFLPESRHHSILSDGAGTVAVRIRTIEDKTVKKG